MPKIRKTLFSADQLTIEATGSVIQFDQMVHNLKKDFIVKLIKVDTDPELCLQRVKARDQQNHIPVSDKQVIDINKISAQRTFDFDLIVPNNSQTDNELLEELSQLK